MHPQLISHRIAGRKHQALLATVFALLALVASLGLPRAARSDSTILYVKYDATGADDGSSWADAFTSLQSALAAATSGSEIWVAAGTYRPTTGTDRTVSFQLKNGVAIYGGFAGKETARSQRNWRNHPTKLSGDIGVRGSAGDNSYHVVKSASNDATALIDGFVVCDGSATNPPGWHLGGGMFVINGSPTVNNIVFSENTAVAGGGMYNYESSPTVSNVFFYDNSAAPSGGGMYNYYSDIHLANAAFVGNTATVGGSSQGTGGGMTNYFCSPTLVNVLFLGNASYGWAGALYNFTASPTVVNATFSYNIAGYGGALYNYFGSSPTITNSILWGNVAYMEGAQVYTDGSTCAITYSDVQAGYPGSGNIDADPLFLRNASPGHDGLWGTADDDFGDPHLRLGSPAVDAGDNAALPADFADLDGDGDAAEPTPRDLDGHLRLIDVVGCAKGTPVVDMGAYETLLYLLRMPLLQRYP